MYSLTEDPGPGSLVELISQDSFLDKNLQAKQVENIEIKNVKWIKIVTTSTKMKLSMIKMKELCARIAPSH